ncbi:hypothetical protein O181_037770 [Austropuccinia psidii MF-1]|uniref:Uncharacterized protein n=1 Tax=Austropuccinia psidii MF-1 TaxID=1389203 RepID=A0A9Q3HDG9_9BASI|nr:hypothetical protein [Austropuccinia psidii MF-1]
MTISRSSSHFKLIIREQVEIKGRIVNNLMRVEYSLLVAHDTKILVNLWHQCLGHPPSLPADTSKATRNNNDLVVGGMDGTLHPDSVEVVDEPHLTEVVEAEAVDEVFSTTPDCSSRRVDKSLFPSGDPNTSSESTINVIQSWIKVIRPTHPTLILGDINQESILT